MKTLRQWLKEDKSSQMFELGQKVDLYVNDKKPKDRDFERAANVLRISVDKAKTAWNVYTWGGNTTK